MATTAQIAANQLNAQSSTGPITPQGKAKSSRNAAKLGLFSIHDFVRPEQEAEYQQLTTALWKELRPEGALQETLAAEILRASWRLQRCAQVEADFIVCFIESRRDPMQNEATAKIQNAVDRARAQSHNIIRRSLAELRRLKVEALQVVGAEPAGFGFSNRTQPVPPPPPAAAIQTQSIARSAPCPCGSREKYKRCCGRNAPAQLHQAA